MESDIREGLFRVVRFVASPLRFFAIAIIILVALVFGLAWKSCLPPNTTALLIYIILGAVGLLICIVSFLIIVYPKKLVFDQEAHLTVLREKLGDNKSSKSYYSGELPSINPTKLLNKE